MSATMLDMRSVRLELLAANAAHDRLMPLYEASHIERVYSEQAEIETVNMIRALRAATEKLINGLHLELTGKSSEYLFFPANRQHLAGPKYAWLDAPEVRHEVDSSLWPGGAIERLRQRYKDAAHHGAIRHKVAVAPGFGFGVGSDGMVVSETRIEGDLVVAMTSENLPQFWRGFSGIMLYPDGRQVAAIGDFFFDDDSKSVMGFLIDAYNASVRLYQRIGDHCGWDTGDVMPFTMGGEPSDPSMQPLFYWPDEQDSPIVSYVRIERGGAP